MTQLLGALPPCEKPGEFWVLASTCPALAVVGVMEDLSHPLCCRGFQVGESKVNIFLKPSAVVPQECILCHLGRVR